MRPSLGIEAQLTLPATFDRRLLPILSVAFVGSLGFSIVLPFLVFVVTRLGGNALVYGALGATYSAFQLVGAPILGRWSDRVGRKRVLLVSQLGTLLSWLVFLGALYLPVDTLFRMDTAITGAFALTLPLAVLFLARALDGLTGGNVSVANAYLADITPDDERSAGFGKMAVATNLGFVLGPAIAGTLGGTALGEVPPVLAAIGVSLVAALVISFGLADPHPCRLSERIESPAVGGVLGQELKECYRIEARNVRLAEALRPWRIRQLLAIQFLVFLAFNLFYIAFPVHAATRLEWTLLEVGVFFSAMGLMMAVVQGPVLGAASKRFEERTLVSVGALVLAGGFALYLSPSRAQIYGATALVALGNGLMWPSLLALLSRAAGERTQGTVQGFASSGAAIASIVGLLVGGVLYEVMVEWIFVVAAGVVLATVPITGRVSLIPLDVAEASPAALRSSVRPRSRARR